MGLPQLRLPIWCCSGWRLPRFTPRVLRLEDSSLWPSSSRRRARALPCIPLCGARTFLCVVHSGCLADSLARFYRRAGGLVPPESTEVARIFVIGGLAIGAVPA